jgi:hypothetical protein
MLRLIIVTKTQIMVFNQVINQPLDEIGPSRAQVSRPTPPARRSHNPNKQVLAYARDWS